VRLLYFIALLVVGPFVIAGATALAFLICAMTWIECLFAAMGDE
jgi:hypothetical protein